MSTMDIVILPLCSDDVGDSAGNGQRALGTALEETVSKIVVESAIARIFFAPVIVWPKAGEFKEKISYLRSESAVNLTLVIPHEHWIATGFDGHVDLLTSALVGGHFAIAGSKNAC